jgi:phosphoglycerate dehydrogenase-like enzyme
MSGIGRRRPGGKRVVLGVLYPGQLYSGEAGSSAALAELRAVDRRLDVLVCAYEQPRELRVLRTEVSPERYRARETPLTERQRELFDQAEIVFTQDLPSDLGWVAPNLKWVQGIGAGTEHLQAAGLAELGIRLSSGAGTSASSIAEFVIGRILAELKRFRELDELQHAGTWERRFGQALAGRTVGLLGLGAINSAVAQRLRAFGVRLIACRRRVGAGSEAGVDAVYGTQDLALFLAESDIVVAAVPETAQTRGLMNSTTFAAMRRGAFFVNVGRGSLVDEAALIAALRSGQLRGAALDVTASEPLAADDPLWDVPNLYLSSHNASSPDTLWANLHTLLRDNIVRYLAGEPLINEIDVAAAG